jgi:ABC-2 type transport system permease protein
MAVEVTMAQMKFAILRHAFRGRRAQTAGTGAVLGGLLAAGTVYLAFSDSLELLAAAYAVWLLGWALGPVFMGGGDETVRPEYFALLGLPARRLATGLLTAAFVGVAPLVSLTALLGLVVVGVRDGNVLLAVPAMLLQLAVFVLLSKVCVALVGLALRSRLGAIGSGLVNGLILAALGQIWVFFALFGQTGIPAAVWFLPSSWGLLAAQGSWWALAALFVAVLVLLAVWASLLGKRATRVSGRSAQRRITAVSATGAVVAKELRTWSRDLVRNHQAAFALAYGVCFAASPLLIGWNGMLPYAGPIFVVMAAGMTSNLYGTDGTALWLTVMTPGASDVRGRQLAWLSVQAPIAIVLSVAFTLAAGGPWPLILALLAALLGGAAGLIPLVSVYALVPGTDPHRRAGNPLRTSEDDGGLTGLAYLMLASVLVTGVPAALTAIFFGWAGVPVGVLTGVLCWWGFGLLAERRLRSHGPELLDTMRTGRKPQTARSLGLDHLSKTQKAVAGWCFGLGAVPLIPQGILAVVFVANGTLRHSWFLATYLPAGWRYLVAGGFIALGLAMYGTGLWLVRPNRPKLAPSC